MGDIIIEMASLLSVVVMGSCRARGQEAALNCQIKVNTFTMKDSRDVPEIRVPLLLVIFDNG